MSGEYPKSWSAIAEEHAAIAERDANQTEFRATIKHVMGQRDKLLEDVRGLRGLVRERAKTLEKQVKSIGFRDGDLTMADKLDYGACIYSTIGTDIDTILKEHGNVDTDTDAGVAGPPVPPEPGPGCEAGDHAADDYVS